MVGEGFVTKEAFGIFSRNLNRRIGALEAGGGGGGGGVGGGGSTFLSLTDTPGSYVGASLKYVRVNSGVSALEFGARMTVSVSTPSGGDDGDIWFQYDVAEPTHAILSSAHYDTVAAGVVAGDIIYGNATPKWERLGIGTEGYFLKVVSGYPAWAAASEASNHNLLSGTHTDTLVDSVLAGDLLYGNITPKWARLAKGTDGHFLKLASGFPAWGVHGLTYTDVGAAASSHGHVQAEITGLTTSDGPTFDHIHLTNKMTSDSATTGTLMIGALTGVLKGTAGVVSAITNTTSADYLGGDAAYHTLNQAAVAGLTTTASPEFAGLNLSDYTYPMLKWYCSGGGTDSKYWDFYADATYLRLRCVNDAYTLANTIMSVVRSGYAVGDISFYGAVNVLADTDAVTSLGRAKVGYCGFSDYAGFAHYDNCTPTNYALLQYYNGETYLNCASGTNIFFRCNNSNLMSLSSAGILTLGTLSGLIKGSSGALSAITNGSNDDFLKMVTGSPAWMHIAQADITGLTTSDTPVFDSIKLGSSAGTIRYNADTAGSVGIFSSLTTNKGAKLEFFNAAHSSFSGYIFLDYGDFTAPASAAASLHIRAMDNGAAITAIKCDIDGYVYLPTVKSGATQVAAGAVANEIWKTSGHATLPNNVLMIGV